MSHTGPKQNLSGHVCFDVPQTRFFQEVNAKVQKLEMRRRAGLVPDKRSRNPLAAEKSPRSTENFEYQPPPGKPAPERWNYPDSDWGLMAKFSSQKQIYDEIWAKERDYELQVSKVAKIREENQRKIKEEFERQRQQYDVAKKQKEASDALRFNAIMSTDLNPSNKPNSTLHQHSTGPDELDLAMAKEARKAAAAAAERARRNKDPSDLLVLKKETAPPTDFYHTNITTLKSIGDKHPEVLAEWRAQRAAEFVSKNARSLEVPKTRALGKNFRPGGIMTAKPSHFTFAKSPPPQKKAVPLLKPVDPTTLDLNTLKKTLHDTEVEIERQQLKIRLNSKPPKHYEMGRTDRSSPGTKQLRRGSL